METEILLTDPSSTLQNASGTDTIIELVTPSSSPDVGGLEPEGFAFSSYTADNGDICYTAEDYQIMETRLDYIFMVLAVIAVVLVIDIIRRLFITPKR